MVSIPYNVLFEQYYKHDSIKGTYQFTYTLDKEVIDIKPRILDLKYFIKSDSKFKQFWNTFVLK